jgi:hypothetical protein
MTRTTVFSDPRATLARFDQAITADDADSHARPPEPVR